MLPRPALIAVMGATASGKTGLAEALADEFAAQLINADAFQAYRGMDIGTAKPCDKTRYRLLDIKDPDERYGVGEFCRLALDELNPLFEAGQSAIVVGGTGLYIRALFEEYADLESAPDPVLRGELNRRLDQEGLPSLVEELRRLSPDVAQATDLANPARVKRALERSIRPSERVNVSLPPFRKCKIGVDMRSGSTEQRVETRTRNMVHNGWVAETQSLLDAGYSEHDPGFRAIGYKQIAAYLRHEAELEEAVTATIVETLRYAKRQRTWLRSEPELTLMDGEGDGLIGAALTIVLAAMQ